MKFITSILLTALLSFVICLYMDWWSIAVAAFIVAICIHQKPLFSFLTGFIALQKRAYTFSKAGCVAAIGRVFVFDGMCYGCNWCIGGWLCRIGSQLCKGKKIVSANKKRAFLRALKC